MRGVWLLVIAVVLIVLFLALRARDRCPSPDQVWVLSDRGWVCVAAAGN